MFETKVKQNTKIEPVKVKTNNVMYKQNTMMNPATNTSILGNTNSIKVDEKDIRQSDKLTSNKKIIEHNIDEQLDQAQRRGIYY